MKSISKALTAEGIECRRTVRSARQGDGDLSAIKRWDLRGDLRTNMRMKCSQDDLYCKPAEARIESREQQKSSQQLTAESLTRATFVAEAEMEPVNSTKIGVEPSLKLCPTIVMKHAAHSK